MTAILPRRLRVHPRLGRRNLLVFLCLHQCKQPPNLLVRDQSASAPMNRNTLGLIVVGSGILFVAVDTSGMTEQVKRETLDAYDQSVFGMAKSRVTVRG